MKKSSLIIAILVSIITQVFAQQTSIGFFGGINSSSINGSYYAHGYETTSIQNLRSLQFGFVFSHSITDKLSLYSNPGFFAKGFTYDQGEIFAGGPGYSGSNKFNYVDLPLTLKLSLDESKLFYIRSGFYMSFLLSAKIEDKISYPSPDIQTVTTNEKITEELNKSVFGYVMGAGLDIPLSEKTGVFIDISYQFDLSNAIKNNPPYSIWYQKDGIYSSISEVKNRSLLISAGMAFKVGNNQGKSR
ncbi:MAG: PorT family protein [Bacteroidales bacterium]|nr:PorT family protein [Bacteroidales bacterium]MCF8403761.1 PorT family protein [Bacteroidales bacterium]